MRKITVYLLICITGAMCAACAKSGSNLNGSDKITESMSHSSAAYNEASKEEITETEAPSETEAPKGTETEVPSETETAAKYELNTVGPLEDDGREMSAAEALRSAMKGKHSALELMFDERWFSLIKDTGWQYADKIKDLPDTDLARINMLTYNRQLDSAITPIERASWRQFTCVDLDQNGTKEVLVLGGPGGVMLHYAGGEVYMTVINVRHFPYNVYENGICEQGDGSAWSFGYDRYYPAKGAMYSEEIANKEEGRFEDGSADYYKINNEKVTKEEYDSYIEELIGGLTPLEWHDFTEENIDKYVVD